MSKPLKKAIIVALLGVLCFVGFSYYKGASLFSSVNTYYMMYNDINGLTLSNPVVVNGLAVGKVKNLELQQDGDLNKIKVTIVVENKIQVGDGTTAILQSSDLLGGKMILLDLKPNSEVYPTGRELTALTEKSITEEMEFHSGPVLLNLDSTVVDFKEFSDQEDSIRYENIKRNMKVSSYTINKMLYEAQQNANVVSGNIVSLTDQLDQTQQQLTPLLQKMTDFKDSLNKLDFKSTIKDMKSSATQIKGTMGKMNSNHGTIGAVMTETQLKDSLKVVIANIKLLSEHMDTSSREFMAPFGSKLKKKHAHWSDPRFHK